LLAEWRDFSMRVSLPPGKDGLVRLSTGKNRPLYLCAEMLQPQTPEAIIANKSDSSSGRVDSEAAAKRPMAATDDPRSKLLYHGTRADLKPGDLIEPGYASSYGKKKNASYVCLTGTLDAAAWGRSWRRAKVPAESTFWNRPARSWKAPI
jgi:hypothetical protein